MSTGLKANPDGSAAIQVGGTDVITLTSGGAATFVTSPTTVQAGTAAAPSITTSGDTNTGIFFPAADTIAFAEGGVESMRIDSSGRLLIGDTTSRSNLAIGQAQVQIGSASFSTFSMFGNGNNSDGSYISLSKARGGTVGGTTAVQSGDILGGIFFEGYNGTGFATAAQIYTRVDGTVSGSQMPGRLEFYTTPTGSNSAVERARISAAGGFMVGMNNFTGSLSNGVGFGVDPVGYMQVVRNQDPPIVACRTVSTGAIINLAYGSTNTNGVVLGNISTNGSTISYNPSSDRRLKEDIQPMRDALTAVMKLKPVTYKWKNTGIADDGFIAQDLLETPEFTHRVNSIGKAEDESDIYGVDYMKFVSVLTAAIQEQQAMIDELKAKVAALEGASQ